VSPYLLFSLITYRQTDRQTNRRTRAIGLQYIPFSPYDGDKQPNKTYNVAVMLDIAAILNLTEN